MAYRRIGAGMAGLALAFVASPSVGASTTTCAQAMERIRYHPGIESNAILATVATAWRGLDQQTISSGHGPIASRLLASQAAMNSLVQQCRENPGQPIEAAAGAIYLLGRQQWDGY